MRPLDGRYRRRTLSAMKWLDAGPSLAVAGTAASLLGHRRHHHEEELRARPNKVSRDHRGAAIGEQEPSGAYPARGTLSGCQRRPSPPASSPRSTPSRRNPTSASSSSSFPSWPTSTLVRTPFHPSGGHTANVALGDNLDEGPLGPPAGLGEPVREVGALAELRDLQRNLWAQGETDASPR